MSSFTSNTGLTSGFYVRNRKNIREALKDESLAILHSNHPLYTNGDGELRYLQDSNLIYLSGITQKDTILVLIKSTKIKEEAILFISKPDPLYTQWNGEVLDQNEASNISGIDIVKNLPDFDSYLTRTLPDIKQVYLSLNEHPRASYHPNKSHDFARWMQERYPLHQLERLSPYLHRNRMIKSEGEISLIRQAISFTREGLINTATLIKPGIRENELEARLSYDFIRQGSRGVNGFAFSPIIASGKNSCVLHYINNDQPINSDTHILLDVGAEYKSYLADITRCFPTSGRFPPRTAEIYQSVLNVLNGATSILKPGLSFTDYQAEVKKLIETELVKLKLIKKGEPVKTYFPHGISHYLGLEVHDVGDYQATFQPGMVITCEPGIYVPEEGVGIRLENDLLITDNGVENLSKDIPIEIEEVESMV